MKPTQPVGRKKFISSTKKQFLKSCREYAIKLEQELQAVYNDPNTIVGKLSMAFTNAQTANKRLSVLCASILKASGGKVVVAKADLESFQGMAINVKWEPPEGVKMEDATEYTFSYDTISEAELNKQQAVPQTPPAPQVDIAPPGMDVQPTPMPIGPAGYDASEENSLKINIEAVPTPPAEVPVPATSSV